MNPQQVVDPPGTLAGTGWGQVPSGPLVLALGAGLFGSGFLLLSGVVAVGAVLPGLLVLAVGLILVGSHRRSARLGWANGVTLARLVALCWIAALTATLAGPSDDDVPIAVIAGLAVVCLALDGVDGHVARARGEASDFGARFDMETDAAMIMVLCVAVALQGIVGWWVLAIGLFRYVFWLCSLRISTLRRTIAPSLARKVVAVVQSVALLLCLVLDATAVGPAWLPPLIVVLALAALTWSFGSATLKQFRADARPIDARS